MSDAFGDQVVQVSVVQRIKRYLAFLAVFDKPLRPQEPKLMRDGGTGEIQQYGKIADTQLAFEQSRDDLDAGRVAHGLEGLAEGKNRPLVRHGLFRLLEGLSVHTYLIALIRLFFDKSPHPINKYMLI